MSNRSVRNRGLGGAARDRYPLGPMGREQLEPQELVERETLEPGGSRRLTTRVAVTAAVLAVLASISSLQAERTAAESILQKNEAVLWQSRASDEWAYRQAKSIKLHLQELTPGGLPDADTRHDIAASEERARAAEERRDEANRQAAGFYEQRVHVLSEMDKTIACSIDRAGRELDYAPRVALEEGMRRSLRWVFENQGGIEGA